LRSLGEDISSEMFAHCFCLGTSALSLVKFFCNHPRAGQITKALVVCHIAHFACYGTLDSRDPSNSGLILQRSNGRPGEAFEQDRLIVHRISELQLGHLQIAYLSACSTAENKEAWLLDEVIQVVSGLQEAGFPHVVGCLWAAGDSECVVVAR
jgi:CHAT domain-containing protein